MARTGYPISGTRYRSFYYDIGSDIGIVYYYIGGHSDIGVCTYIGVCSDIGTDIGGFDYDIGASPILVF